MNRYILPLLCLLFISFLLNAQEETDSDSVVTNSSAKALIVYAEGKGFSISRGNNTDYISIKSTDLTNYELKAGDLINVEASTVLEIQIYPSGTRLRVSESSTFRLGRVNQDGSGDVEVLYGSVRTQSDKNLTKGAISLKGLHTVNAAKGADFELEMVYNSEATELVNRVYCLEGKVEIMPAISDRAAEDTPAAKKVVLKAREMLTIKTNPAADEDATGDAAAPDIEKETLTPEVATALQEKTQFKVENTIDEENISQDETEVVTSDTEENEFAPEEKIVDRKPDKLFWFGAGTETSFMLINAANLTTANPLQDGFFNITNLIDFLLNIRYGVVADLLLVFNPTFGIGLEVGLLDSSVEIFDTLIHFINVPALFIFTLTPGPVFIQIGGGLACIGYVASYTDPLTNKSEIAADLVLYYELGLKLGVKIDNIIVYTGCATDFRSLDHLLNSRIDIRINLGASMRM